MSKKLLLAVFCIATLSCFSQNLVPNGSFEIFTSCPSGYGQIYLTPPWMNPTSLASPDFLHLCASNSGYSVPNNAFGNEPAHSGEAYSGITLYDVFGDFREYLEIPLTSPLVAGTCYYFEMYLNLGETYSMYTTDDIGVYFSDTLININSAAPLTFVPQLVNTAGNFPDTSGWTLVSGTYTATGGESYILIGNFLPLWSTTVVLVNGSAPLEDIYTFVDDVLLIPCTATGIDNLSYDNNVMLFPNPFSAETTVSIYNSQFTDYNFKLFDIAGREVLNLKPQTSIFKLGRHNLSSGIYFYNVTGDKTYRNGSTVATGKIIIE